MLPITDLANVATLGAVPGVDCTAIVMQALTNGAPGLYYPPGAWVQNSVDLTVGATRWKAAVRGASRAVTSISTSVSGANVFQFVPPSAQEAFLDIADLELISGPGCAGNTQDGYGIVVIGPTNSEIGKGSYKNIWGKNFLALCQFQRHNDAVLDDVLAEYSTSALVAVDCGDLECKTVRAPV